MRKSRHAVASANVDEQVPSLLVGVSGEYFVAAELSRRGFVASISLRNTRGIDILATNESASRSVTIQVKTSQRSKPTWLLSEKSETIASSDHFYVFVLLNGLRDVPSYFVVPSETVASYIRTRHRKWLAQPGRRGRKHVDSSMRKFEDPDGHYRDKWELLRL